MNFGTPSIPDNIWSQSEPVVILLLQIFALLFGMEGVVLLDMHQRVNL
jgi:hypothetical protein